MLIQFDYIQRSCVTIMKFKSMNVGSPISWWHCNQIKKFAKRAPGIYDVTRDGKVSRR